MQVPVPGREEGRAALAGWERFEEYDARVAARLAARRGERAEFLAQATQRLAARLREAEALHDPGLSAELALLLEEARLELASLPPSAETAVTASAAQPPTPTSAEPLLPRPAPPASPASPSGGKAPAARLPVTAAPATSPTPSPLPAAPPAPAHAEPAAETRARDSGSSMPSIPASPASPPPPLPRPASLCITRLSSRVPAVGEVVLPARASSARPRAWALRPVEEIDAAVRQLEEQCDAEPGEGEIGLLRLKAMSCRQRRAFWELDEQGCYSGDARALYGKLKARVQERFGDRYVLPLNTGATPSEPAEWEALAQRYEALALAMEATDWFEQERASLRESEQKSLLGAIGATQQQLYRLLDREFRGAMDDQQRTLYERLRQTAADLQLFITTLNPNRSDEELAEAAGSLAETYARLREGVEKRDRQQHSIAALLAMARDPEFGTHEPDPARLASAARECLAAGMPPSHKEVRDALLPWAAFLAEEPDLARLVREIDKELNRRAEQETVHEEDEPAGEALSPEVRESLAALLPYTRGKRCLFIGGSTREEKRQQLEEALELADLVWPEARKSASVYDFEAEIARCDIAVLLIRFMRTGFNQAVDLCRHHDTRLVRLPRGLGLTRVITDFSSQLVPRPGMEEPNH